MKKITKASLLALLAVGAFALASYGLIQVDSPFAQTEIVNQRSTQNARGFMNALTAAGSKFVVRFDNGNGTYTFAIYMKVYGGGSAQYFRISQTVTQNSGDTPEIEIDQDLLDEAEDIIDKLVSFSAIGDDEVTSEMSDYSNEPLSTSLVFPPGALVVINGNGRPAGIVTCEPACTGSY